jgi:uncharacterized membrane protein YgdD (TMEM256/DUF423 family)
LTTERLLGVIGAAFALCSVAAGAFAAHALRSRMAADLLTVFETAARYQMYHAVGILFVAVAYGRWGAAPLLWAGWSFVAGTLLFSGSLYLLAVTGVRWLGAVTPVGGVCFLAGWALLAWGIAAAPR